MPAGGERLRYLTAVPHSVSAKSDMLAMEPLPVGWEYLLFSCELRAGIEKYEQDWRDYSVSYAPVGGPVYALIEVTPAISKEMGRSQSIVNTLMTLMGPVPQENAFGRPGEPGDRILIEHLAMRLTDTYGQLILWGLNILGMVVPNEARALITAVAKMVSEPIQEFRDWATKTESELISALTQLENGATEPVSVTAELVLTIGDDILAEVNGRLEEFAGVLKRER